MTLYQVRGLENFPCAVVRKAATMPLIVPILRLAYVFSNVFETFKTLRPAPPSSRNNGQPSLRALSQRKRAMKGCMAVWLCWVGPFQLAW